jgi:CelD/BcsL family acetyltransferase involved in cellulose biosynthesis
VSDALPVHSRIRVEERGAAESTPAGGRRAEDGVSFSTGTASREWTVATDLESAMALREHWMALLEAAGEPILDPHPDLFAKLASEVEEEGSPYVALRSVDGRPAGLVVGRVTSIRPRCKVGYWKLPCPSLRSLVVVTGGLATDGRAESWEAVRSHLGGVLEKGGIEMLVVSHLPEDNPLWNDLAAGLDGGFPATRHEGIQWFAQLAEGGREHSTKTLATFRRKDRKLVASFDGDVSISEVTRPEEVPEFVRAAALIGSRSYQGAIGVGVQDTPKWHAMLTAMAELGNLRAYRLEAGGEAISYVVGPVYRGVFQLLATAFDMEHSRHSPGSYLLRKVFESLRAEGVETVDFGYGDAAYKQLHGTDQRQEATFNLYSKGLRTRLARGLERLAGVLTAAASGVLRRLKVYDAVKKRTRARLAKSGKN